MAEIAEKGCIYEYIEKDGSIKNMMLVIGNKKREVENLVSVLMLGNREGGGNDAVEIRLNGEQWMVHCGLVTYAARVRLGRKIGRISDAKMSIIERGVRFQLGLAEDREDYKTLYENLLDKVVGRNDAY